MIKFLLIDNVFPVRWSKVQFFPWCDDRSERKQKGFVLTIWSWWCGKLLETKRNRMKDFTRFFNIFLGRGRLKVVEESLFPWENKRKILHKYDVETIPRIERCEIISNIKNFIRIFPFISKFQTSTTFRLEFILLKFRMSRSNFLCLSSQISLTYCSRVPKNHVHEKLSWMEKRKSLKNNRKSNFP